jgi:hypothetical protein
MSYVICDVEDNCWIGNDQGPIEFQNFEVAALAAKALAVRMKLPQDRYQAQEYYGESVTLLDEITPEVSLVEAMEILTLTAEERQRLSPESNDKPKRN